MEVPVKKEAQKKTAFPPHLIYTSFKRMPFGLQGAPIMFLRMMDKLLDGQC